MAWGLSCVEQLLWLQVLTVPSQGLPAPPLDVYLWYQKMLLTEEEQERQKAEDVGEGAAGNGSTRTSTSNCYAWSHSELVICQGYVRISTGLCCYVHWLGAGYLTITLVLPSFSLTFKLQPRTMPRGLYSPHVFHMESTWNGQILSGFHHSIWNVHLDSIIPLDSR